jgi:YHS domain-containing protein
MADVTSLASRIDAEFTSVKEKVKKQQTAQVEEHKQRQKRMEKLAALFDELREIWRPRLELLAKKFGDRVKTTPRIVPATREVTFEFQSHLAHVRLRFSAYADTAVQKVILSYDLEILPVFIRYRPHAEVEFRLEAVDKEAVARFIDDQIIEFIHTYFAMGENEIYLKDEMVEDPVAHVSFPRFAAATTLDWQGKKYYFIGEETRREFEEKQKVESK